MFDDLETAENKTDDERTSAEDEKESSPGL